MARRPKVEQQILRLDDRDPWAGPAVREAMRSPRTDSAGEASDALLERYDDYINRTTGIGDYLQDKTMGGSRYGLDFMVRFVTGMEAEDRWRGTDLGARVVEKIPEEMTREGWEVSIQPSDEDAQEESNERSVEEQAAASEPTADAFGGETQGFAPPAPPKAVGPIPEASDDGTEMVEAIDGEMERLGVLDAVLTALQYERAYGGAAILIGADDGMDDLTEPLDENNIKSVRYLNVLQGGREGECIAWTYYRDPREPKYGEPEIYLVRNIGVSPYQAAVPGKASGAAPGASKIDSIFYVHESRLLVFKGKSPSRRARVQMRGWGDSIFTRIEETLANYSQTWGGVANMMTEFKLDVLSVNGMAEKVAADRVSKGNPLIKRARTIQMTKSIARMLVIDKDKESAQRLTTQISGVSEILEQFWLRLAAAVGMPLSLLTGQVKGGLGDAGNTDMRFFYDEIASTQNRVLGPLLKRLIHILFIAQEGPTEGEEPARWTIKMRPLYRLSALEEAARRKTVAETDAIYITQGVVDPSEIAGSRFGGSQYSAETTIDIEGREEMAEKDLAEQEARKEALEKSAAEMAKNPPPPTEPPVPPVPVEAPPEPPEEPATEEEPVPPPSKADELEQLSRSLESLRRAGAVVDMDKLAEQFPDMPVKRIIEDE